MVTHRATGCNVAIDRITLHEHDPTATNPLFRTAAYHEQIFATGGRKPPVMYHWQMKRAE